MIKLIVGLCNPGSDYEKTRHNAGAWLVRAFADSLQQTFSSEKKFKGLVSEVSIKEQHCWLLLPTTYMNNSGQAIKALASFYKIDPTEILVVHDELDFPPGIIRLKQGGGSGGHNGLKDTITHLGTPDFYRLRVGIGHPGDRSKVLNYVLSPPNKAEKKLILEAIDHALPLLPDLLAGKVAQVMQELHTTSL